MLLDDLGSYLETVNGSVTVGTDLFLGRLPAEPANAAALMEYEGETLLARHDDSGAETERPRVQLIVRAESYAAGRAMIQSLWTSLLRIVNTDIGSVRYQRVQALQSPFVLDRDDTDRVLFAANFAVVKQVA